nr:translational initiation factor 1 [Myrtus communis]UVF29704.1 translational initiation factor 1 [Myrtus communis]
MKDPTEFYTWGEGQN